MKTKEELKNTYIEINGNEKLSRAVQEKLFEMGFKWITGENYFYNTQYKFIGINETFKLYHTNYENHRTVSKILPSDLGLRDDLKLYMKTIETTDGIKYQFTEEQLEAAKVVDTFDWVEFGITIKSEYEKNFYLTFKQYLQARCLSLWNERAIKDNGGVEVDWDNREQFKYTPYYKFSIKTVCIECSDIGKNFIGEHYLETSKCQEAIAYFGPDFMKCLLGVKDKE